MTVKALALVLLPTITFCGGLPLALSGNDEHDSVKLLQKVTKASTCLHPEEEEGERSPATHQDRQEGTCFIALEFNTPAAFFFSIKSKILFHLQATRTEVDEAVRGQDPMLRVHGWYLPYNQLSIKTH